MDSERLGSRSGETPLESWTEIGAYLQRNAVTARRWEKEEGLPVHRHSKEPHACRKDEDSESSSMRLRFGRSLRRAEFPRQTQETSGAPAVSRPRSRRQLPVLSLNRYCNRKDRNYPRRFAASLVQQQPREHHGDWLCASGK